MKRFVVLSGIVGILLMSAGSAIAIDSNAGTAGYNFLKIGVGARAAAMGNAYVGLADDFSAFYFNPAGLTGLRLTPGMDGYDRVREKFFAASYNNWIVDIQSGFLGLALPAGKKAWIGTSIQYMNYGDLTETDIEGTVLGNFGSTDFAFALSGATQLNEKLALGVTGRIVYQSLHDSTSWGLAADLGLMYYFEDQRTQLGAAITNLGAQMDGLTESHKDELPITFAVGGSHYLEGLPLVLTGQIDKSSDDQVRFALGTELVSLEPFYLRAGFSSRRGDIETGSDSDNLSGFSGGLGVLYKKIRIDYAIGHLSELGTVHRIGLFGQI